VKNWQLLEIESIASGFSFSMCFRHGAMPTVQPLALNPAQVVLHVKVTSHSLYQQNSVRDQLYYPETGFFDLPHTSADAQCSVSVTHPSVMCAAGCLLLLLLLDAECPDFQGARRGTYVYSLQGTYGNGLMNSTWQRKYNILDCGNHFHQYITVLSELI